MVSGLRIIDNGALGELRLIAQVKSAKGETSRWQHNAGPNAEP